MRKNWRGSLSSRKRKLICWVLGLFLLYTITGFLILPPIVRAVAVSQLSTQFDRKVSIQQVKINPLAFSTTINGLLIQDKDGQPFVSWDQVYVRFELSSIVRKAWTFREISVVNPYARAQMNKDYTFNFSDLVKKFSTNAAPAQPSKPLFVRVKHLSISGAKLSVADYTVRTPFKRIVGPLNLTVQDLYTGPGSDSPYSFAGTTDAGEMFSWRGYISLDPLRSKGQLTVDHVTLNKFAPLYQDIVSFQIRSGQFGVHADYRFEWSPSNQVVAVTNAAYALRNFRLTQPGSTNDIVRLFHLAVVGASADLEAHRAEIGRISANGGRLFLERDKNNTINVVQIAQPSENNAPKSGVIMFILRSVTNAVTMLVNSTNEWTATIHEVNYTNCSVHLADYANLRPATLDLDKISFNAKNISNLPNTNLTAALSMRWNTNGTINISVTALISPPTADIHMDLNNLNLNTLDAYLESQLNLLIPNGNFGLLGDVHVRTPTNGLPNATFQGDTWVKDFHTVDGVTAQDLLKWGSLYVSGIDASLNPMSVSIKQIALSNAGAQIVIETNKAINLLLALNPAATYSPAETNRVIVSAGKSSASKSSSVSSLALPPITISTIVVTNTQIKFTDLSVTPSVSLTVDQAGGTITGISSKQLQHGDVNLHAVVGDVGQAEITGHINPFIGTETNVLRIYLTNMDLLPASPYSGKYAGYRIARGSLSLDLTYVIVGRKIKSQNVITIEQFTFGDKVNSPDATKLPVRLAVAILKDREGNIVLDVPVEGSLDDPKFRIHKVLMRAITDILVKVATSPFSLLGAAFGGGGQELSYEDFAPGSAVLSDSDHKKLNVMVKALYERPALQLQLSGSIDPVADRAALQRAVFDRELRMRAWSFLGASEREQTSLDEIVLTPSQRSQLVDTLYDEAIADGKITPALLAANTNLAAIAAQIKPANKHKKLSNLLVQTRPLQSSASPAGAATAQAALLPPVGPKEALLTDITPISENDLEALAINRAQAVRTYILSGGQVEANRLFLAQNRGGSLRQDGSRVYLELN